MNCNLIQAIVHIKMSLKHGHSWLCGQNLSGLLARAVLVAQVEERARAMVANGKSLGDNAGFQPLALAWQATNAGARRPAYGAMPKAGSRTEAVQSIPDGMPKFMDEFNL